MRSLQLEARGIKHLRMAPLRCIRLLVLVGIGSPFEVAVLVGDVFGLFFGVLALLHRAAVQTVLQLKRLLLLDLLGSDFLLSFDFIIGVGFGGVGARQVRNMRREGFVVGLTSALLALLLSLLLLLLLLAGFNAVEAGGWAR